ncbi:45 kDa calcium-binding protein-like [Physella acuta]|uniref:45 kDa calcium-binding protein-like n=1 Tax=Physella acuta TaxID=109671 RepID=UPI0027DB8FB8|nr:45 kDa calcium-binding protein-like [Physella acuta]
MNLIVLILTLLLHLTLSGPIPKLERTDIEVKNQDHRIDNLEIHHDQDVDQKVLAMDSLPDQTSMAEKSLIHQEVHQQQQEKPVLKVPNPVVNEAETIDLNLEMARKIEKLPMEKLIPVDHLDVVKMEQDGHVNKDYHKEMFLGGLHDEFRTEAVDHAQDKLQEIVFLADTDGDGSLSKLEMETWILKKMAEHFDAATKENDQIFEHLDPDGDGFIKWKEYYVHFLLSRGFDVESALNHVVDYDDSVKLDQDDKDALISYKFKWTDADHNITDNKLSKYEFMVFRHPEHSMQSLDTMVNNVMRGVDANKDGVISEEEFAALPPGEVEGKEFEEMDRRWQEERRVEFREIMDKNNDGKVDLLELKNYLDPTNPVQAKLEADSLMSLMDEDKNNLLSMDEIIKHSDLFIASKLINFAANVHDEF